MFQYKIYLIELKLTKEKNRQLNEYIKQLDQGFKSLEEDNKSLRQQITDLNTKIGKLLKEIDLQSQNELQLQQKINKFLSHNCFEQIYQHKQKKHAQQQQQFSQKYGIYSSHKFPLDGVNNQLNGANSHFFFNNDYHSKTTSNQMSAANHSLKDGFYFGEIVGDQPGSGSNSCKNNIFSYDIKEAKNDNFKGNNLEATNNHQQTLFPHYSQEMEDKYNLAKIKLCNSYQDLNEFEQNAEVKNSKIQIKKQSEHSYSAKRPSHNKTDSSSNGKNIVYLRYSYNGASLQEIKNEEIKNVDNNDFNSDGNNKLQQMGCKERGGARDDFIETEPEEIIYKNGRPKFVRRSVKSLSNCNSLHRRQSFKKFDFLVNNQPSQKENKGFPIEENSSYLLDKKCNNANNQMNFGTTNKKIENGFVIGKNNSQNLFSNNSSDVNGNNSTFCPGNSINKNGSFPAPNILDDSIYLFDQFSDVSDNQQGNLFQNLDDEQNQKEFIKNSQIGDLLFENFLVIGPNLQEIKSKVPKAMKQNQNIIEVAPEIVYKFCERQQQDEELLNLIRQRSFPFNVQAEIRTVQITDSNIDQSIKDIIYPQCRNVGVNYQQKLQHSTNQNDEFYLKQSFVFNFNSELSYKNQYTSNPVMLSSNPNSIMYCVCLFDTDFYIIREHEVYTKQRSGGFNKVLNSSSSIKKLNQKRVQVYEKVHQIKPLAPGTYKIAIIPKLFCFMTYYPFIPFFINAQKAIRDYLSIQNMKTLQTISSLQIQELDFANIAYRIDSQEKIIDLLCEMQVSSPEFSKLLYFKQSEEMGKQQLNQWVPPVSGCAYLESQWGCSLLVSSFQFDDFWYLLTLMLSEQHVLLFTEDETLLTSVILTLIAIIKPFSFIHVQNFSLDIERISHIENPVPYLIGVKKNLLNLKQLIVENMLDIESVVLIDLDTSFFYYGSLDPEISQNQMAKFNQSIFQPQFASYKTQIKQLYQKINPTTISFYEKQPFYQLNKNALAIINAAGNNNKNKKKQQQQQQQQSEKENLYQQKIQETHVQLTQAKQNKLIYNPSQEQLSILQQILVKLRECFMENIVKFIPEEPIFEAPKINTFTCKSCSEITENMVKQSKVNSAVNLEPNSYNNFNNFQSVTNQNEISPNITKTKCNNLKCKNKEKKKKKQDQGVLNYKKISQRVIDSNKKNKQFLTAFTSTQIFTYFLEQKYQLLQQTQEENEMEQEKLQFFNDNSELEKLEEKSEENLSTTRINYGGKK